MIRLSDVANAAAWTRPAAPAPRGGELNDPSSWFDGDAAGAEVRICGDLAPGSRGLSIEQHAARVLAFLCGERDAAE
ncbi:MAG TPA: hypothetical protein VGQ23_12890 [Burkholderiaceae bacterium]|jgi:hypothetical protein|nr:hypothetical protein [Burkholderiaceae bacterium]